MLVVIPVESRSCEGGKIWNFIGKTVIKLCLMICPRMMMSEGGLHVFYSGRVYRKLTAPAAFQQEDGGALEQY